jgi:beta-1,4-mannosyltransferase
MLTSSSSADPSPAPGTPIDDLSVTHATMALRVASVPATHVYVRHLAPPSDGHVSPSPPAPAAEASEAAGITPRVERVADPSGDDLRTPCFLDPAWWRAEADALHLDVLHVHFGFEYYDPAQLAAVCDEAHARGVAVVYTCHDLRNPNHPTPELHEAGLAVWLAHADEVVTLTPWAARQLAERWGRAASVLPHPHVVPLAELERRASMPRRRHADRYRIGLHLKSLRPNFFHLEAVAGLLAAVEPLDGVQLEVRVHHDVLDPRRKVHAPDLLALLLDAASDAGGRLDLMIHHYLSDDQLWDAIAGVDAMVLPYRFGTHSGLLEACRDLGTAVITSSVGGYGDQGAQQLFDVRDDGSFDTGSFVAAVQAAVAAGRPEPIPVPDRIRQRAEVARGHLEIYRRAVARRRGGPDPGRGATEDRAGPAAGRRSEGSA